jgi:hypothetical protein
MICERRDLKGGSRGLFEGTVPTSSGENKRNREERRRDTETPVRVSNGVHQDSPPHIIWLEM